MGRLDGVDDAGRAVAGLLGYNPGPGIYSRLERAVEAMPANVRVQELPGLLKRYKEGVPGWELKEADFPGLVGDAQIIPKQDLLDRVRERSPVFTHREVVLGGTPTVENASTHWRRAFQEQPSPLGLGVSHGSPRYEQFGQGGKDYAELLVQQPGFDGRVLDDDLQHWDQAPTVAHARFDMSGDALRINELQSDLARHNRRRAARQDQYVRASGGPPEGGWPEHLSALPFPLEDAWSDLLVKRLALEAARRGARAIEIASPSSVFAKTGNPTDGARSLARMEQAYGKVVPGSLESLGRKLGGLAPDENIPLDPTANTRADIKGFLSEAGGGADEFLWRLRRKAPGMGTDWVGDEYEEMVRTMADLQNQGHSYESLDRIMAERYQDAYNAAVRTLSHGNMLPVPARRAAGSAMGEFIERAKAQAALQKAARDAGYESPPPGRRYIMSDEMRRRLIEQGVGASVLAPLLMQGEE